MAEGSLLLLEEYFASGDSRFLAELRQIKAAKKLLPFADRWLKDPRPWAREQLHAYLDAQPVQFLDHRPLLKKLFKLAEAAGDDRLMARFLVAFDRSVRRADEYSRGAASAPVFTVHTLRYLMRRSWRYFRRLGFRDPKRYLAAVLEALPLYTDGDTKTGVHFLDNWGLIHVLFHGSAILRNHASGWFVKEGQSLADLKPAPAFHQVWEDAGDAIFTLMLAARSRPVRRTARAMLKGRPGLLEKVPFARVVELLEHPDEELQALGVELLPTAAGLESAPLEVWMRLLEGGNLEVLEAVCAMISKVVAPERFSTDRLVAFATSQVGPVARLGLDGLKLRELSPAEILDLSRVRARSIAADAVAFARERLAPRAEFDPMWLLAFLDSTSREVRESAWTWFADEKRARHRLDLWARLVESPYDDVRLAIVNHLERFAEIDTALRVLLTRAPIETIWATVLLNIHRGSRAKRLAAGQIAAAIEREPAKAPQFLPLLAIAARSLRAPEFRAGLAAVVRAATRRPEIAEQVARHFPELQLAT